MTETIVTHVQTGETLSSIAARYRVSVDELQKWNRIENPDLVLVGQEIVVYNEVEAEQSSGLVSTETQTPSDPPVTDGPANVGLTGLVVLGVLLLLLLLGRNCRGKTHNRLRPWKWLGLPRGMGLVKYSPRISVTTSALSQSKPQVSNGERLVSSTLKQNYSDWILIDNIMLPSGKGTTQIDHILVAPNAVFVIETKDVNGWVFGSPGQRNWTQTYIADRMSRRIGLKSRRFSFYNPLWQNEGHARALANISMVDRWRIRPIVVFVGDFEFKTSDKYLPFSEHEKIARDNIVWRMRGVICESLAELHRYIGYSITVSQNSEWTRQQMESAYENIRVVEVPLTAATHQKHIEYVELQKELNSR